jgi:hypothetical protein
LQSGRGAGPVPGTVVLALEIFRAATILQGGPKSALRWSLALHDFVAALPR